MGTINYLVPIISWLYIYDVMGITSIMYYSNAYYLSLPYIICLMADVSNRQIYTRVSFRIFLGI